MYDVERFFRKNMNEKRNSFCERVKAAYVLNTSLNIWGKVNESNMSWLAFAFPGTELQYGNDQGASYTTITPKFSEVNAAKEIIEVEKIENVLV